MSGQHLSKEFFELVKSIGESRSKQEEDKIILNEIVTLKHNLNQPNLTAKKLKEYMIRAVYVEMLGHDASFAYIKAVNLTNEKSLMAKRVGYLSCNLFLHKDHDLIVLLINTMQRDLNSPNHLEVCAALTAVCRLVNLEMIPAISPLIFKLLSHPQDVVRKKAIVVVHRFYKLVPETLVDQRDAIRKMLCDPEPSVMGASLHILYELAKANPGQNKDLVPSFVSILKQITEHRLPRDFDYHRMPAPWLQVKLLSILGQLGTADQKASEQMYEILTECMRRADSGVNVGYAIIYECVRCITRIYPDNSLLELAASNISRFISSDNHNLKYLGVTGLAQIVQVNPTYAAEHQLVVVDCLEDPDDTLKRKTLDLLYRMTNPQNVETVVEKLTFHLRTSVDAHLRRELVERVTLLAERYAPDNEWYVRTMNQVFELGGELVPTDTAYNLMRLIAEGTGGDDEQADVAFRTFAVNTYLKLLEKPNLSDILVQVIGWILGEFARLSTVPGYSIEDIIDLICEAVERPFEDPATRGYLVTALMKLSAQHNFQSGAVDTVIKNYRSSRLTDLQQRCYEFEQVRKYPDLMRRVLPYDASCEDITISKELPFLSAFVQRKLSEGCRPYQNGWERAEAKRATVPESENKSGGLNFQPYQAPSRPIAGGISAPQPDLGSSGLTQPKEEPAASGLKVAGARKWGPSGYNGPTDSKPKEPEPPKPPPQLSQFSSPAATKPAAGISAKAQEPPELTEKQKMAAALFSGLGGSSKPAAKPSGAVAGMTVGATGGAQQPPAPPPAAPAAEAPKPAAQAPAAPSTSASAAAMDLLDLDDGQPAAGGGGAPAGPPAGGGDAAPANDLLLLDGRGGGAPAGPPAGGGDAGPANDLLLLDMSDPTPSQPAAPAGLAAGYPGGAAPPAAAQAPLLGPLQVTVQQVGTLWQQLPAERRLQLQTSLSSCQDMMARLQAALNVHVVQIIGAEGIAAGRVLPGTDPVFLHGKLTPPRVDLLVKSRDPALTQRIAELGARSLS